MLLVVASRVFLLFCNSLKLCFKYKIVAKITINKRRRTFMHKANAFVEISLCCFAIVSAGMMLKRYQSFNPIG